MGCVYVRAWVGGRKTKQRIEKNALIPRHSTCYTTLLSLLAAAQCLGGFDFDTTWERGVWRERASGEVYRVDAQSQ